MPVNMTFHQTTKVWRPLLSGELFVIHSNIIMANKKEHCGLCKIKNDLVESHLIPKSIYRIIVNESNNLRNPILIKGNNAMPTSKQVKSYFLCSGCEEILNKYGEDHVLRYTYRNKNNFKFQNILKGLEPEELIDNAYVFSVNQISEIKMNHFLHFAAGVFWKASAGKWKFLREPLRNNQLGKKYEEKLRKFLKGDSPFPENLVLTMSVSNEESPFPTVIFPDHEKRDGFFQHRFYIPGIEFILWVGNLVPKGIKNISISHSSGGKIFFESLENSPLINLAKISISRSTSYKHEGVVSHLEL